MRRKEAIEVIKNNWHDSSFTMLREALETLIPELKESEDEKIRKWIREELKSKYVVDNIVNNVMADKALAWLEKQGDVNKEYWRGYREGKQEILDKYAELEKQGEQKPADKVAPRFKIDDWIIYNDNLYHIINISLQAYYECLKVDGTVHVFSLNIDSKSHLWTIQDAKDGDILVCGENKRPFIFKGLLDKFHPDDPVAYCGIDCVDKFFIPVTKYINRWTEEKVEPATKEQLNLLFEKMEEVGYMWDSKNKELQKIKQKPTNNQFTTEQADVLDKHIDKFLEQKQDASIQINPSEYINDMGGNGCYLKNTVQSPTWSDEDSYMLGEAIKCVNNSGKLEVSTEEIEDWLKSIKDKVQPQQKQEWSEEDEKVLEDIRFNFEYNKEKMTDALIAQYGRFFDKIKSLKPQPKQEWSEEDLYRIEHALFRTYAVDSATRLLNKIKSLNYQTIWRPSDEQMNGIECAIKTLKYQLNVGDKRLNSLYQDLEKLKG